MTLTRSHRLEMWGGVECTVNRVGDRYFDQHARSGHMLRLEDLDRFADLGLRSLRIGVLWEHVQPERGDKPNWAWADRALERLRDRGVRPIVGLLHHGFGPRWVDVRSPDFVSEFARYARMVAERYPWVDAYTPINEPLTTARFSGLYGHWYPHARDDTVFARIFLAQLTATARAMREIRQINPDAQLIQTEDLGKTGSTHALRQQRWFENERRWLTWDILSGRMNRAHRCWRYLRGAGVERQLAELAYDPCTPDVIGINHYITSERYLDERVERYSLDEIGGNGLEVYADVAQVQVPGVRRAGIGGLLREAWQRYRLPIAVTECHMGCTREEQMRWLHEVWHAGLRARESGIDVRAITSWALLGSFDWNSLVTRDSSYYESGAFDVRGPAPRPTALAAMIRALANEQSYTHPVLATPGWWSRGALAQRTTPDDEPAQPILIVESGGTRDSAVRSACGVRGLAHVALEASELTSGPPGTIARALDTHRPWAVIATTNGAGRLAEECARRGIAFMQWSPEDRDLDAALDLLLDDTCDLGTPLALAESA